MLAISAYMFLLKNVRPAVATSYAYVNPVVAVLLGIGFAGESLSPTEGRIGSDCFCRGIGHFGEIFVHTPLIYTCKSLLHTHHHYVAII